MKLGCVESLPAGWRWVKAQDCMDVRDGTHDSPKPVSQGVPLVTSKNLVGGSIDFSTCSFISEEDHLSISKRSKVDDGDILYAMIGTIGNPVIVNKAMEFSIKNVALFKFPNDEIFNRYIYHFLNSALAKRQFENKSRGGTQKFVSLGNIRELEIPLPPLEEQKRIAAILDKADEIRRKRQQAIELADEFLRSVFLDMFGDSEDSLTVQQMLDKKMLLLHKDGNHGSKYPRKEEFSDQGVPFISAKDISESDGHINYQKVALLNEKKANQLTIGWLERGDILLSHNATVGRVGFYDGPSKKALIGTSLTAYRPNPAEISSTYLFAALKYSNFQGQLKGNMGQSTRNQVPITAQKELLIPVGNREKQNKFEEIYKTAFKFKKDGVSGITYVDDLFSALSQKAFSGEL